MQHSTTQPRRPAISQTNKAVIKRSTFVIAFAVFGGMSILAGLFGLSSAIGLTMHASMPGAVNTMSANVAFDFILGALILASSRELAQGKMRAVWLYGSSILLDSLYSLAMGYPLHYLFIALGLLLIWQTVKYRVELDLS